MAVKCGNAVCLKKREELLNSFDRNILSRMIRPARERERERDGGGSRERVRCGNDI